MSEIFIKTLFIQDFGPFYGEHVFNFDMLEGKSSVLVGGKNGSGKTHLLRALYLAAVGESGKNDLSRLESGSDATRFRLDESLNRRAKEEGKTQSRLRIEIIQNDRNGGGTRSLKLERTIRYRPSSPPEFKSVAWPSGETDAISDDEHIQHLRDTFFPRHLAKFFFFDAERGQNLNLSETDIVESVSKVLGLWTYQKLEEDLDTLVAKQRTEVKQNSEVETVLANTTGRIQTIKGTIEALRHKISDHEGRLAEIDSEELEIEDELKTVGAVDPQQIADSKRRRDEADGIKKSLQDKLKKAWEVSIPLGLMGFFRQELYLHLEKEERRRDWEASKNSVEPKIPQVKRDVFEDVTDDYKLAGATKEFYASRLESALNRLFYPPPLGMADVLCAADQNDSSCKIRISIGSPLNELIEIESVSQQLDQREGEIRELDQRIRQMEQNPEARERGNKLLEKRGQIRQERSGMKLDVENWESEIRSHEKSSEELVRQETNQREKAEKLKKGRSLILLAHDYRNASAEIRRQAAIQMREQIGEICGGKWIEIMNRGVEYTAMEFDQDWKCYLNRRGGVKIHWEAINTSAGQRQVRLLAFTEALRRLARNSPPLVVDTPLGRLDKEVQQAVLEKLYLTGHQSIILCTNSEIDPEGSVFRSIKSKLSRIYTLNPIGDESSADYQVKVTEDYFGKNL